MRALHAVIVAGGLLGACTDDAPPVPRGPHYQYVVRDLRIPATGVEAREDSLDIDGDGVVDNQLGLVFVNLEAASLGVAGTAAEALARGGLIMLADLQTPAFDEADAAGLVTHLGADPTPAPCTDPAQLATCGQHLLGTGSFSLRDGSSSDLAVAPIIDGVLDVRMPRLPIEIALIDATTPIRTELRAARVRMTAIAPASASAVIAGGITRADIDGVIIPQAAAQMDRIVVDECGIASEPQCGCASGSRAYYVQALFDADDDCRIDAAEVASSSITQTLLEPDLEIDGEQLLSFSVRVELASAAF